MGKEVKINEYEDEIDCNGDENRVTEWEIGLPNAEDLTPLSQALIPPELASAFSISPEPYRTVLDVNRASRTTVSGLRNGNSQGGISSNTFKAFGENESPDLDPMMVEGNEIDLDESGSDLRKLRNIDCVEEADSAFRTEDSTDDPLARTLKRPRLVWTRQLHKRFVDVVAHLGIKNAVPKTIMQMMNVEGLTRENVASHLQKYRLYLKRMQGLSNEGPSSSDPLFASTPTPQSFNESSGNGKRNVAVMPMQMPAYGAAMMPWMAAMGNSVGGYHGFESHPFNMMQQRDWSGNK